MLEQFRAVAVCRRLGALGGTCAARQVDYLSSKMNTHTGADTETDEVEREATQAAALKLFVVLARAHNAVNDQMSSSMAQLGLTNTEFAILEVLHHKGPLLLGEIQRKILVTSGGITYLVDRLAEKGLVKREECPSDRRARYAVLTPAGDTLIGMSRTVRAGKTASFEFMRAP